MSFPDRQTVLDFLEENPSATTKQEIARGLKVKGRERQALRAILKDLEDEGRLRRTGKRAWAQADRLPPKGVVIFEKLDEHGDLVGRMHGRDGAFGPDIVYAGVQGKRREPEPGIGDRGLCAIFETKDGWRAKLIKKLGRGEARSVTGLFSSMRGGGGRVEPADKKDRREIVINGGETSGAEDGDLVVAKLKPAPRGRTYGPKLAEVTEIIGKSTDPKAASLLAIHAHGIPTEFPEEVLEAARNAEPQKVEREDLTRIPLITIDPADARDHDDAVYAEQLETGWRVIVAIADVAAFVTEGSDLDREAIKRGNSTYFPDRVVPMLPEELSADQCSLRENEPRACFAVEMEFDKTGTKRKHRFFRAKMRSAAKLSYTEAQTAIDGGGGPGEAFLENVLKPLWGSYNALCEARERRQPLDLDLPEKRVELGEDGRVKAITQRERFDAHRLIEEFMIQANVCAAETLEQKKVPLIYRVHDQPSDAKLTALADFLQTLNIKWPRGEKPQTSRFNKLLGEAAGGDSKDVITEMVLRTQAQAVYDPENIGHFGLHLAKYAHFTSPIRRYSDLVVHRALIRALRLGPDGLSDSAISRMEETAEHLSTTERRSMAAERDATDRYLAHFMADRVGAEFEGRVTGLNKAGLFVRLDESGADGLVPMSRLPDDYWVHDEKSQALVARGSGKRYVMGQDVIVRLEEATPLTGGLLLEMLTKPLKRVAGQKAPAMRTAHKSSSRKMGKAEKFRQRKANK
ncbi:MAG: ribonuclease R [Pseudomonadota bacterium]